MFGKNSLHTKYRPETRATFGPALGAEMMASVSTSVSTWAGRRWEGLKSTFAQKPKEASGHVAVSDSKMEVRANAVDEIEHVVSSRATASSSFSLAETLNTTMNKISSVFVSLGDNLFPEKPARAVVNLPDFKQFLEAKAKTGFTPSDKVSFSYIRWIDSKGLASIGAFFAYEFHVMFGLGKFDIRDLTAENVDQLRQMNAFYMQLGKTEKVFAQFSKKPDTAKYEAAVKAFEELHEFIENIPNAKNDVKCANGFHQLMNSILNKAVGGDKDVAKLNKAVGGDKDVAKLNKAVGGDKDVAKALLEYFVTTELTKNGGFSQDNILEFYANYVKTVADKQAAGYGVAGIDQNGKLPSAANIQEGTIRMIFAHILREIVEKNGENSAEWATYEQAEGEALCRSVLCTNDEINSFINRLNNKLLKVMETGTVDPSLTSFVSRDRQLEMVRLHKYHHAVGNFNVQLSSATRELDKATMALEQSQKATTTCAYTMLYKAWGEENAPEGFEEYDSLNQKLIQLNHEIDELMRENADVTNKVGQEAAEELDSLRKSFDQAQLEFDTAQNAVWTHEEVYNKARSNAEISKAKLPMIRFDFGVFSLDQEVDTTAAKNRMEYEQDHEVYTREKKAHEALQKTLEKKTVSLENARQALTNKNKDIKDSIAQKEDEITLKLSKATEAMKAIKASSITVTGAQIVLAEQDKGLENLPILKSIATTIETQQQFVSAMDANVQKIRAEKEKFEKDENNKTLLDAVGKAGYTVATNTLNYVGFKDEENRVVQAIKLKKLEIAQVLQRDVKDTRSIQSKAEERAVKAKDNAVTNRSDEDEEFYDFDEVL